jgi:hypothetical protein
MGKPRTDNAINISVRSKNYGPAEDIELTFIAVGHMADQLTEIFVDYLG